MWAFELVAKLWGTVCCRSLIEPLPVWAYELFEFCLMPMALRIPSHTGDVVVRILLDANGTANAIY